MIILLIVAYPYTHTAIPSLFLIFFGLLFYSSTIMLIDALAFFVKDSRSMFMNYDSFDRTLRNFPLLFDSKSPLKVVFPFIPLFFYGYLSTLIYFGYANLSDYTFELIIGFLVIVIEILGIYLLWKYGLKRYEAFG